MMRRPFRGPDDFAAIMALAIQTPIEQFSATALPYQLSSWAADDPANLGLWEEVQGQLIAYALFQVPFGSLLYGILPTADTAARTAMILHWGVTRATAVAQERGAPLTFAVFIAEGHENIAALAAAEGYTHQPPPRILLARPGNAPPARPALPTGFTLRQLRGADEAPAAAALLGDAFAINTVSATWRQRILEQAPYRPELDIVIESPTGDLAAFCLCWLNPNGQIGQIEPMGTHPAYQRLGLGRAALIEGLWRLHQLGVETIYVGTSTANQRSLSMYRSVGFRPHHLKLAYQRTVTP